MTKLMPDVKDFSSRANSHKWTVSRGNGRRGVINGADSAQTTVTSAAPRQVLLSIYINDAYITVNKCSSGFAGDSETRGGLGAPCHDEESQHSSTWELKTR